MEDSRALHQLIGRFRSRLAFGGAMKAALRALLWGALATLLLMLILKCCGLSRRAAMMAFAAIPVALIVGAVAGWRRSSCSPYSAAKQLDQHLKLNDRLANTFFFLAQDPAKRSPLAELAIGTPPDGPPDPPRLVCFPAVPFPPLMEMLGVMVT